MNTFIYLSIYLVHKGKLMKRGPYVVNIKIVS